MNSKLKVSVNKNPTKEGIKVQFVMPQTLEGDAKAQATQKLQSKLNQGLEQYNLTVSQDTDVPYSNVIGFLIPIADIKLLIKNAIGGGAQAEPSPEEAPKTEEPMNELKRMQQLAGLIKESQLNEVSDDDKALGVLFHPSEDGFEWDENAMDNLVKDMGYEDYEEVADEVIHYTSPGDEDEMNMFRHLTGNPNLQPEDITIGMYKQVIEKEFPEKSV